MTPKKPTFNKGNKLHCSLPRNWDTVVKPEIDSVLTIACPTYRKQPFITTSFIIDYANPSDHPTFTKYPTTMKKLYVVMFLKELGWIVWSKKSKSSVMMNPHSDPTIGGILYA